MATDVPPTHVTPEQRCLKVIHMKMPMEVLSIHESFETQIIIFRLAMNLKLSGLIQVVNDVYKVLVQSTSFKGLTQQGQCQDKDEQRLVQKTHVFYIMVADDDGDDRFLLVDSSPLK